MSRRAPHRAFRGGSPSCRAGGIFLTGTVMNSLLGLSGKPGQSSVGPGRLQLGLPRGTCLLLPVVSCFTQSSRSLSQAPSLATFKGGHVAGPSVCLGVAKGHFWNNRCRSPCSRARVTAIAAQGAWLPLAPAACDRAEAACFPQSCERVLGDPAWRPHWPHRAGARQAAAGKPGGQ